MHILRITEEGSVCWKIRKIHLFAVLKVKDACRNACMYPCIFTYTLVFTFCQHCQQSMVGCSLPGLHSTVFHYSIMNSWEFLTWWSFILKISKLDEHSSTNFKSGCAGNHLPFLLISKFLKHVWLLASLFIVVEYFFHQINMAQVGPPQLAPQIRSKTRRVLLRGGDYHRKCAISSRSTSNGQIRCPLPPWCHSLPTSFSLAWWRRCS